MLIPTMLLGCLRPGLSWVRANVANSPLHQILGLARVFGALDACRLPVPVPIPMPRRPRAYGLPALACSMALIAMTAGASLADPLGDYGRGFDFTADGRLVDVQVQVEGQAATPLYLAPGRFDRRYFQAFRGRNYSLVVRNNTGRRVGVLITVDGLNVVNGERSGHSRNESMYVLDPHERTVIRGWRTSLQQVRRFVFVDEERSYAERTGQANGDMGWIRVLAFREQRPYWDVRGKVRDWNRNQDGDSEGQDEVVPYGELQRRGKAAPENARPNSDQDMTQRAPSETRAYGERRDESNPGTGWGDQRYDPVNRTRFTAEAQPVDHLVLRYEYARGLRQLGIRIWNGRDRLWERERGELGFAQPPSW